MAIVIFARFAHAFPRIARAGQMQNNIGPPNLQGRGNRRRVGGVGRDEIGPGVEPAARAEIVENFMVGLRNLFAENYIDIPEEKVDLVDELAAKVGELESTVNEEMEKNIELKKELSESKKNSVLRDASKDLTESQVIKLKSLAEGVDFESEEDFQTKIDTIRENYFGDEKVLSESGNLDDEPLEFAGNDEVQAVADPSMQAYMSAISRSIKK